MSPRGGRIRAPDGLALRRAHLGGPRRSARWRRRPLRSLRARHQTAEPSDRGGSTDTGFGGDADAVATVATSGLQVFAQNLETVRRLTRRVRDPRAGYQQTLNVLAAAKTTEPRLLTKSSLMVGLGETADELRRAMADLRDHDVDLLTLGQYLRPTAHHLPVERWVHPDEFAEYREVGLSLGFVEVASGPLVRSSYRADRLLDGDNIGLGQDADRLVPVRAI